MNILKSLIWLIPLALGLSACEYDNENPLPQDNIQVVTGEIHDITLTTVTLDGTVNPSSTKYKEVGIAYCIENSGDDLIYATATDHSYGFHNFSVTIRGLQPDRTYTYHAYLKDANGKLIHSDTKKTFHTESPEKLLKNAAIQWVNTNEATLCWDMTDEDAYNELASDELHISFGVAWSAKREDVTPSGNHFSANTQKVAFNVGQKNLVKLISLKTSTEYFYTPYISLNGELYVTSTRSFVTLNENASPGSAPSGARAIDMGLPSGTKWANMNVGAEKVHEIGLFYAWGETDGYNADGSDGHLFGWTYYKWCNGARSSQNKYCTNSDFGAVDNKAVLDLTDDVAFVKWGSEWRMPTNEEFQELIENTTQEWTTLEGVNGYRLISKITGNYIFIPAAGCRVSESNYEHGTDCYLWSSSVDQPSPYASRYFRFYVGRAFLASMFRYYGMNVRPVKR